MTNYAGFEGLRSAGFGCGMLVLVFCCYLLGVCLGLGQCFWGSLECAGDPFFGIIDLMLLQIEGN